MDRIPEFQDTPWGTIAWKGIYRPDRAIMEGLNGTIKDRGGLDKKSCRVFGIASHTLATTATLVCYNIRTARKHGQTDLDNTPNRTHQLPTLIPPTTPISPNSKTLPDLA